MSRLEQKQQRLDKLMADRQFSDALRLTRQLARERPANQRIWLTRSEAARMLGDQDEALRSSERALELGETGFAIAQRARCLLPGADWRKIAPLLHKGLQVSHDTPWVGEALGGCAVALEAWPEAQRYYERLTSEHGTATQYRHMLAVALDHIGDRRRAVRQLKRVLNQQPAFGAAYWSLLEMAPEQITDDLRQQVNGYVAARRLDDRQRMYFCQTRAQLLHRDGDHDQAFDWYGRANALRRARVQHDPEPQRSLKAAVCERFDKKGGLPGEAAPGPVFLVGMPCSGSTLVEQLLRRSGVCHAAGELRDLEAVLAESAGARMPGQLQAAEVSGLPDNLEPAGREYLDRIQARGGSAGTRVIDSNPFNYRFIGPLLRAVPGARVVHVRRSPLEAVWANYSHLFTASAPWSCTLEELLTYYRQYHDWMSHWQSLYPDRILNVDHDTLLDNTGAVGKELYAHCGLDWSDGYATAEFGGTETGRHVAAHYDSHLAGARRQLEKWKLL